ncbi:MAG: hypothetical protein LQ348_000898 [Seirophora lacunosa]|nr:MAG: hypothetical protein LQ348_000898 [Seirophora lacunosa]
MTSTCKTRATFIRSMRECMDIHCRLSTWTENIRLQRIFGVYWRCGDRACRKPECTVLGPSKPGVCTYAAGSLFDIEIADHIQQKGLKPERVPNTMSKQEYWDDQRVGFDDSETLAGKTNCAAEKCFGGTMIWSLDMDSSHGSNRPVIRLILNLDDGRRTPATVPTADTSATSSSGARGQTVPVAPVAPVAAAPGKSTNTASGTKSPSRSTISSQTGSSKKSSSISVSFSATGSRPSGQSTGATSQGQALPAALMIPGIAPVPSPMLAPELMVTKGYGFYSGFVAFQRKIAEAVQDFTIFSGSETGKRDGMLRRRATSAKPDDVESSLGKLASAYA